MAERRILKHYEILSRIGEGGMGVVYRARDTRLGRTVALKTLHAELAQDEERTRRFEREARIVSALSHPGIATLYDFDRDGDTAFLTMEFVEGPTLRECLSRGPMPIPQLLDCAVQVAGALAAAHKEGVVHRDLKPDNVIASPAGYYKVLDFGVARFDDSAAGAAGGDSQTPTVTWATKAGGIIGTVAYMSPEQALGRPVDARSDIFSFGSMAWELATGKPAFSGNNEIATAHAITQDEPPPLADLRAEAPPGLELVLRKCLAKRPEDRYASADALARDLRILRQDSQSRSGDLRALEAYGRRRRRRWWLALPVLVAVAALVLWFVRPADPVSRSPGSRAAPVPAPPAAVGLARATPASPRVVVAFFENNSGDPEADWLSKGLPEMLTTDLSRSAELEVIATQRIYDLLASAGRDPEAPVDRSTAAELARWAGATVVISGSVFKAGDRYRIDAQAHDTRTGTVLVAAKTEGADLLPMVTRLTAELMEGLKVGTAERGAPEIRTTTSTEAWRAYSRGRRLHENLMFEGAIQAYRDALDSDERFELARLRLAISELAGGNREVATALIEEIGPAAEEMPERERLLALGLRAFLHDGDHEAGEAHLKTLIDRFPESVEAYVLWADLLTIRSERVEATGKLREAITRDPNHLPAIAALSTLMAELGLPDAAVQMLSEAADRNPEAGAALGGIIEALEDPTKPANPAGVRHP